MDVQSNHMQSNVPFMANPLACGGAQSNGALGPPLRFGGGGGGFHPGHTVHAVCSLRTVQPNH